MDAIELLKKDHAAVATLFDRFNDGGGVTGAVKRLTGMTAPPRERRTLAERICNALDVHARIEEAVFYPAVRALDDDRLNALLHKSLSEHATIKERVAAIRSALGADDELRTRAAALQECVEHHVREEEQQMFPLLAERMPAAARARVGRTLAARKRSAASHRRTATAKRTAIRGTGRKTTARARKRSTATGKKAGGERHR